MENITNPIDKSSHSIFSNIGQNILKKYLNVYANFLGGKTVDVTVRCDITDTEDGEQNITCKNLLEIPRSDATSEEIIEERLRENAEVIDNIIETTPIKPRNTDPVASKNETRELLKIAAEKNRDLIRSKSALQDFEDLLDIPTKKNTPDPNQFASTRPSRPSVHDDHSTISTTPNVF